MQADHLEEFLRSEMKNHHGGCVDKEGLLRELRAKEGGAPPQGPNSCVIPWMYRDGSIKDGFIPHGANSIWSANLPPQFANVSNAEAPISQASALQSREIMLPNSMVDGPRDMVGADNGGSLEENGRGWEDTEGAALKPYCDPEVLEQIFWSQAKITQVSIHGHLQP